MLFQLPYRAVFAEQSIAKYQTHLEPSAKLWEKRDLTRLPG